MRERWHQYISKLLGKPFPAPQEEAADSAHADEIYSAAVKLQIGKTRDTKKYHLLFKENMHYGFCRNLFAMRPIGIIVDVLGVIASCAAGVWFVHTGDPKITPWVCAAANTIFLFLWIFTVKSEWVKIPAFAYAERLFESTEQPSRTKKEKDERKV